VRTLLPPSNNKESWGFESDKTTPTGIAAKNNITMGFFVLFYLLDLKLNILLNLYFTIFFGHSSGALYNT
jgi:hypothetical protein